MRKRQIFTNFKIITDKRDKQAKIHKFIMITKHDKEPKIHKFQNNYYKAEQRGKDLQISK